MAFVSHLLGNLKLIALQAFTMRFASTRSDRQAVTEAQNTRQSSVYTFEIKQPSSS